jgi:hypothetical protein
MMPHTPSRLARAASLIGAVLAFAGISGAHAQFTPSGQEPHQLDGGYCSSTASALFRACGFEAQDDYWKAIAKCTNVSGGRERADCLAEARAARSEKTDLCRSQYAGRLAACRLLGENRYDPEFDPEAFESDFKSLMHPNRYFPLTIGNRWEYRGGTEVNTLEVLNQTKLVDDVTCVVVRDVVKRDGRLAEATEDWYAQAKDGNVWYCGEEVKNYETFAGDKPRAPELVSIDGSFKAGRGGDKPGVIFLASPSKGDVYLEEFSLGNAEDVTEILSTTYRFGTEPELDRYVPRALASILCAGDCIVTKNYSLLEPGAVGRKYFAPGVGFFLEVKPDTGNIVSLTSCNFDSRCPNLPKP